LTDKIRAYALQEKGLDTVDANHALGHGSDDRTYEVALKMLNDLNINKLRLLTNNPLKVLYLEQHQINVTRLPLLVEATPHNEYYQQTKARRLGHHIPLVQTQS
jgi:GTP cyclohydrolase II